MWSDLLFRRALGWNLAVAEALRARGVSQAAIDWVTTILPTVELALLLGILATVLSWLGRVARRGSHPRLVAVGYGAAGLWAARLAWWIIWHPSNDISPLLVRWDYLACCTLAGPLVVRFPNTLRIWGFAAASLVVVSQYVGWEVVRIVLAGCLLGYAAARWLPVAGGAGRAAVQGAVLLAVGIVLWRMRRTDAVTALAGWGLFQFVLFRHISFVVETGRGATATLGNYLCYLFFFPSCVGAMEVYPEFLERNLRGAEEIDYRRAIGRIITGSVFMGIALHIGINEEIMLTSASTAIMWQNLVLVFVRGALFVSGLWAAIEGGSLLFGFQLRPNFSGVLTAASPSQFWRAWRGTMTNWLIQYVYIPLGGNRRHRTLNIFAAFVVSTAWHLIGIPFLRPGNTTPLDYAPIALWGGVNFVGVAAHAAWRRRWPPREHAPPLAWGVRGVKTALTLCFGTMTVALLGFSVGHVDRFVPFLCMLLGISDWCGVY